jgi:hypothetical protein
MEEKKKREVERGVEKFEGERMVMEGKEEEEEEEGGKEEE